MHPFLDVDGPIAFAHRGGALAYPENTMRAFHHAVSLGFTHLETDVHVTSDGVAVAFHDDSLDRVTDRSGTIAGLPWREVKQARIAGTDPIPRLEELFEALPESRINLDPKSDAAVEPLAQALRRLAAIERVCVGSFSGRRIAKLQKLMGPRLCVSAGPLGVLRLLAAGARIPASGAFKFQAAQVPVRANRLVEITKPSFVQAAHHHNIAVHVWTINEEAEMHRLLELGVDGIMTDRPEVLRRVMIERGHWPETRGMSLPDFPGGAVRP